MNAIALTLVCVLGIAAGQVLFRLAAQRIQAADWLHTLVLNPWLWTALVVYGVATLLWIWVLRTAPLHRVYPFFALAFVLVPFLESWVWAHPVRWQSWAGGVIIAIGVVIAVSGSETP